MSELSQAIEEMRNMRESYDSLAAASSAYNEGRAELAANLRAKGIEASETESLPALAEKVTQIQTQEITIDGGEMYEKQLFGSLTTPKYWNLYDILQQLLSDPRLDNYGGILLAEYYRGYDNLALAGAGSGGAYVVSDMENGVFKMYTEDVTHTWNEEWNGYLNRWVAYCFADEYHDFQITDTSTSPRSIFIGRKVGIINCLVNTRISQMVVPDGNELKCFGGGNFAHNFSGLLVLRNVTKQDRRIGTAQSSLSGYCIIAPEIIGSGIGSTNYTMIECSSGEKTCLIKADKISDFINDGALIHSNSITTYKFSCVVLDVKKFSGTFASDTDGKTTKELHIINIERASSINFYRNGHADTIFLGTSGTLNEQIGIRGGYNNCTDRLVLQRNFCRNLNVSYRVIDGESEMQIREDILQRLKQDEPDCGDGVTITLGSTNLAKLTSEESVNLLDELTNTYGYTFA